jgi:hypothetical protein
MMSNIKYRHEIVERRCIYGGKIPRELRGGHHWRRQASTEKNPVIVIALVMAGQ